MRPVRSLEELPALPNDPAEMAYRAVAGLNVECVGVRFFGAHRTPMACSVNGFHPRTLWTNDVLVSLQRIYEAARFKLL
jgi:hypothetical protein